MIYGDFLAALYDVIVGDDIAIRRDRKATSRSCFSGFIVLGFRLTYYGRLGSIGIFELTVFPNAFFDGSIGIGGGTLAVAFIV